MDDSEIDNLLRSANQQISLPRSFRRKVWSRIESSATDAPRAVLWMDKILASLARPVGAAATVTLVGVLGFWLGVTGSIEGADEGADAKLAYVETVSPFVALHGE